MGFVNNRKSDKFHDLAKAEDYRSRSAYKLKELDGKFNIIKPGFVVLDLGAAPGSWSQVALEKLNGTGFVLAVDILLVPPFKSNFDFLRADFTKPYISEVIESRLPERADVVLCDASPEFSGVKTADLGHAHEVNKAALSLAQQLLKKKKGAFVCKVFQSKETEEFVKYVKKKFAKVLVCKPKASKKDSVEKYIVGLGLK